MVTGFFIACDLAMLYILRRDDHPHTLPRCQQWQRGFFVSAPQRCNRQIVSAKRERGPLCSCMWRRSITSTAGPRERTQHDPSVLEMGRQPADLCAHSVPTYGIEPVWFQVKPCGQYANTHIPDLT